MSLRIKRYGKRLGFLLATLLISASLGISGVGVESAEGAVSRGFAKAGVKRPGVKRPGVKRPGVKRPAANINRPAINRVGQLPARPFIPPRPIVRPIINPVVEEVKVVDPCVFGAEVAGLFLNDDQCVLIINNEED
jgi:hypothetical protein